MRVRLMLSFVLIVLVSVTSVVLIARQGTTSEVRAFMYRGGMSGSGGLVASLEDYYLQHATWQGVESLFSPTAGRGMGAGNAGQGAGMMNQRLRLADDSGRLIVDTKNPQPETSLTSSEIDAAIALEVDGRVVGYLLAEGGTGFTNTDETLLVGRISQAALTAGLIAGGFSLLLALGLAYTLLRPVQQLTQAAKHLGQGDLTQRVRVSGQHELALLGRTFNRMADSLQRAEENRQAMTADIAHELRNPLAVQRANLEALQDGIYPLTADNLQPILEQNLLLSRLVDDLRTLALADAGQLELQSTPVDLIALVKRVVERFHPQAVIQQVQLDINLQGLASQTQIVFADAMRIEQIINNLLSNAIRYTPPEGKVLLSFETLPGRVKLIIHDSGPGIPEAALGHIFERFYRADRSRSRAEGGTGLGLTIARQLALAHSGSLQASNHPEGGAIFSLELPLSQP